MVDKVLRIHPSIIRKAKMSMARALYTSAVPFNFVRNPHFKEFAQLIGLPNILPTYDEIKGKLLDEVYEQDSKERGLRVGQAATVSLSIDTTTNVRGLPVISMNIHTPVPIDLLTQEMGSEKKEKSSTRKSLRTSSKN